MCSSTAMRPITLAARLRWCAGFSPSGSTWSSARRHEAAAGAYRTGHEWGNRVLTGVVGWTFGGSFDDMLSGYRALSRRFVKSFPALATGFETETELTVHALSLKLPAAEIETPYFPRPEGSTSKLQTWRDGARILITIVKLLKEERPLAFFPRSPPR